MSVEIAKDTFGRRVKLLYDAWKVWFGRGNLMRPMGTALVDVDLLTCSMQAHRSDLWDNANILAVLVGGTSDDLRYLKSISLHLWLFGYELPGVNPSLLIACINAGAANKSGLSNWPNMRCYDD